MCGILGFAAKDIKHRAEFISFVQSLFAESVVRGSDATGFAGFAGELFFTDKAAIPSPYFVNENKNLWDFLRADGPLVCVGHTRAATSGSPKDNKNNHPHHGQRYSMVHNGGIWLHERIAAERHVKLTTECDSELILHMLERKEDTTDGVLKALLELDDVGNMAVAFLNRNERNLHLFRTKDSPCVLFRFDRWNAVVFASTIEILVKAALPYFGSMAALEHQAQMVYEREIPDYTHIMINTDLEISAHPLQDKMTAQLGHAYRGRALRWLDDSWDGAIMGALATTYKSSKKNEAKEVDTSVSSDTQAICPQCFVPLDSLNVCKSCGARVLFTGHDEEAKEVEEKKASRSSQTNQAYDATQATMVFSILPLKFCKEKIQDIPDKLRMFREPMDDFNLSDYSQQRYILSMAQSAEDKFTIWSEVDMEHLSDMNDGEYLAYFEFVSDMLACMA